MALCLLAKQWWQGFRESGIHAERPTGIVVDHGLRPDSAAEALQVQSWVSNLGQFAAWPLRFHRHRYFSYPLRVSLNENCFSSVSRKFNNRV